MALDYDSAEYEYLEEAVELSKNVDGLLVEIGLRKGWGTKTIIDACVQYRPNSTVLSIDPFGSIAYEHREGQICRLDYDEPMYKQVLVDLSTYVLDKPVNWQLLKQTDTTFFAKNSEGVELYDTETYTVNKYAMVHLDGPHGGAAIATEINWFNDRMDKGATIAIDDISEDFIDIKPVNELLVSLGWNHIKTGNKKSLWQKK